MSLPWPGPRDAEEGERYQRDDADSDAQVFEVIEIDEDANGCVTVTGRWVK